MDIRIKPHNLSGKVLVPPSKSVLHRAVICAALSRGVSEISPAYPCGDILSTLGAVKALGARGEISDGRFSVFGIRTAPCSATIDCGESGSTLRFILPVAAALGVSASFCGRGRLPSRPVGELASALVQNGVTVTKTGDEILTVSGKLKPGVFEIPGNVSSQYITGLLLALPLLDGDSRITLTSPLESRGYADMTISVQKDFGIDIIKTDSGYHVKGNQKYVPCNVTAERDFSSAAVWAVAAAIGGSIGLHGLDPCSIQCDKRIFEILDAFGAHVENSRECICVTRNIYKCFSLDISETPDLMPILAVLSAFSNGTCKLYNARRLRTKESDRLSAVSAGLRVLGANITENPDGLVIAGNGKLQGGKTVESFGDHRVAMAMTVAASNCKEPSTLLNAGCVDKSYPDFYNDFTALGGVYGVL